MSKDQDAVAVKPAKAPTQMIARRFHGLGSDLQENETIEQWTKTAGMKFTIHPAEAKFTINDDIHVFPDKKILYRGDTKKGLSIVGKDFKVVQPKQVMEFFRDLAESKGFKMETAGALQGGKKFWAMARVGEGFTLMKEDKVIPYLLLASSCDGSMATTADFTSVRVICENTLRQALANSSASRVRVTHAAEFDPEETKIELGVAEEAWEEFTSNVTLLAKTKIGHDEAVEVVSGQMKRRWETMEGIPMTSQEKLEASSGLNTILRLFDGAALGASFKSSQGTAWGLVNAVSEYVDHHSGAKRNKEAAFIRAQFSDRAAFKTNVANKLIELAA